MKTPKFIKKDRKDIAAASFLLISWMALRLILGFILLINLRHDTSIAFTAESMTNYGDKDETLSLLPPSAALSPLSSLIEADAAICAYTRHLLAACWGLVGDDEIDTLESSLTDTSGHGYYLCWKAEEAIGRLETAAEYTYGINLTDRPLSDLSYIDSVKDPDPGFVLFAARRAAAGAEIGNMYKTAETEWDTGRKRENIFITLVFLSWLITFIPAFMICRRVRTRQKLRRKFLATVNFKYLAGRKADLCG